MLKINKYYIFLRLIAISILIYAIFSFYIGIAWFYSSLSFFEKLLGIFQIGALLFLVLRRPSKGLLFFCILIISSVQYIYFFISSVINFTNVYDIVFPLTVLIAFVILYIISYSISEDIE